MTDTENLPALPDKWCWTTIGEIAKKLKAGGTPSTKVIEYYENGTIPFVKIEDMGSAGKYLYNTSTKITKEGLENSAAWEIPENSILYSMYASYGIPIINKKKVATSQAIIVCIPQNESIFLDYLYYYLLGIKTSLKKYSRGTTQENLNAKIVNKLLFPLPPLPEQHRIVQKIEELFTDLDAGVQELEKAKVQIKNYKKAVLKAAFMGDLTEEWREKNIFADSESSLISKTKTQKGSPENLCYFELPENWFWTNLQELGIVSGGVTKNSKRNSFPEEIPYLRVANVYSNHLELEEMKCIGVREEEIERYLLKKGDLLVVEGNGSLDQIGRVALWDGSIPKCIHQNHIIKVRFNNPEVGKYVLFWLLSIEGRKNITLVASSTSGLYTLSISKVSSLPVPLAPLSEQKVIVSEIERCFSVIDQVEKTIAQSLAQAEKLRQSILKKAFEGKLVPQDPNNEPASVLLERIKQEKGRAESRKKPGKGRKMKAETIIEVSGNTKQAELF